MTFRSLDKKVAMGEETNKDVEPEKVESEPLDGDEIDKIVVGNAPYGHAPDGTLWKLQ